MAEEMAMSQNRILPDELMIEILSRVDTSNHLELKCVCKLWKSLVLDPYFMKNIHLLPLVTDLGSLWPKTVEQFNALKSRIKEEEEEKEHEDEVLDLDGAQEEEEEEGEEDEEEDGDGDGADVDAELKLNLLAELGKFMEKEKELKGKNLENLDEKTMMIKVAKNDNSLVFARYIKSFMLNFLESIKSVEDRMELKGNLESIRVEMQTMEDRYKYIKSFIRSYLRFFSIG